MCYQVMIVEDEPPIARYLTRLVNENCSGFRVVATAENGAQALEKIDSAEPDVILTDVKMPVLDGIGLVKTLKSEHPEIYTVIVSGYQDFEYAREAIKYGVVDYLLKPVAPEQLKDLFQNLATRLDQDYHSCAVKLLAGLIFHLPVAARKMSKFLNYPSCAAFLIRKGALPIRLFNRPVDLQELCFWADRKATDLQKLLEVEKVWLLAGRDESETLLIAGIRETSRFMPRRAAEILANSGDGMGFYTITHSAVPFPFAKMAEKVGQLFETLDQSVVIGKNQILDNTALPRILAQEPPFWDSSLEKKLEFLIQSRSLTQLRNELDHLFAGWEKQGLTQLWVEKIVRRILGLVEKHAANLAAEVSLNLDKQLNGALLDAPNFPGLFQYLWEIIEEMLAPGCPECPDKKSASLALFARVEAHIRKNMAESLTLQGICDVMGVSQPYVSRLFRKYQEMSFVEYLNGIRVQEAKRLMADHPEMLLKDVAALVGYKDPYYFSRIFKLLTGLAPSEYKGP